jgi:phage FluMu protein Com
MPVPIRCPSCATVSAAPDSAAGKKVKCPKCKHVLILPVPSHAVAPIPPAVPREPTLDSLGVVEDKRWSRKWLWLGLAGGVIVILLLIVALVLLNSRALSVREAVATGKDGQVITVHGVVTDIYFGLWVEDVEEGRPERVIASFCRDDAYVVEGLYRQRGRG